MMSCSTKRNSQKNLKKGDKVVVTVENAINDCVVVSLIVNGCTFCGVLLDSSKKTVPHGIFDVQEHRIETRQSSNAESKQSHKTPFPQPLLTRSTYKLNVSQPPLRNIFRRIRRSRRNTKLNMVPQYNDELAKRRNKNNSTGSVKCDTSDTFNQTTLSKSNILAKSLLKPVKRKACDNDMNASPIPKKLKMQKESPASSDDEKGKVSNSLSLKLASPLKNLIPKKVGLEQKVQRTPAIKIKYKSPAGRGRVLNIPSKVHPPCDNANVVVQRITSAFKKSALQEKIGVNFVQQLSDESIKHAALNDPHIRSVRDDLKMLKLITDVEIKHCSENPVKNHKSNKVVGNFVVTVNKDSKKKKEVNICNADSKIPTHKEYDMRHLKNSSSDKPLNCTSVNTSPTSSSGKNRHLRVVLKPLSSKSGFDIPNVSDIKSTSKADCPGTDSSTSPNRDSRKNCPGKKSSSPCSHTIYVTTCKDLFGVVHAQGDVVWGKLTGYPWWPSRIVKLIVTKTDGEVLQQEAMVGWFRSSTTSIIPLTNVQAFEKNFQIRFEKKRKGIYQRAVSDAKSALKEISPEVRKLISQFET